MAAGDPLPIDICETRAAECRALSRKSQSDSVRIMLEHIAETWERIAQNLKDAN